MSEALSGVLVGLGGVCVDHRLRIGASLRTIADEHARRNSFPVDVAPSYTVGGIVAGALLAAARLLPDIMSRGNSSTAFELLGCGAGGDPAKSTSGSTIHRGRIYMVGGTGDDAAGRHIRADLTNHSIECGYLRRVTHAPQLGTSVSHVLSTPSDVRLAVDTGSGRSLKDTADNNQEEHNAVQPVPLLTGSQPASYERTIFNHRGVQALPTAFASPEEKRQSLETLTSSLITAAAATPAARVAIHLDGYWIDDALVLLRKLRSSAVDALVSLDPSSIVLSHLQSSSQLHADANSERAVTCSTLAQSKSAELLSLCDVVIVPISFARQFIDVCQSVVISALHNDSSICDELAATRARSGVDGRQVVVDFASAMNALDTERQRVARIGRCHNNRRKRDREDESSDHGKEEASSVSCSVRTNRRGSVVGVTDGANGCFYTLRGQRISEVCHVKANGPSGGGVTQQSNNLTIDTTGAGDAYHGAFLAWLLWCAPGPRGEVPVGATTSVWDGVLSPATVDAALHYAARVVSQQLYR